MNRPSLLKPLTLLKIGGSVITAKRENVLEVKKDQLERIAGEIAGGYDRKTQRLCIVHGVGPFGHRLVTDYALGDGLGSLKNFDKFARVHQSVAELNQIVCHYLQGAGLPVFPLQPSALIVQNDKVIDSFSLNIIEHLLDDLNAIPVLYGDMVYDRKLGASVVSGDALIGNLGRTLAAERILLGTDVDGIFSADPGLFPSAYLYPELHYHDQVVLGGSRATDVTGGMAGKIAALHSLPLKCQVFIFNAAVSGRLESLLSGKKTVSTRIHLET